MIGTSLMKVSLYPALMGSKTSI